MTTHADLRVAFGPPRLDATDAKARLVVPTDGERPGLQLSGRLHRPSVARDALLCFGAVLASDLRSTQVFINHGDNTESLDGQGFSGFGRVVDGMDVAAHIPEGRSTHVAHGPFRSRRSAEAGTGTASAPSTRRTRPAAKSRSRAAPRFSFRTPKRSRSAVRVSGVAASALTI